MTGRIVAIVEARMSSTRLPGKVLLPAAGRPMLAHLLARLRRVPSIDHIVVATSVNPADDALEAFARDAGVGCHRGSEADVMSRVLGAATAAEAAIVVSITGDCPIVDPELVEQVVRLFLANDCDYASNAHRRSYPDGMDVQVYTRHTLQRSSDMTQDALEREHVTLHIRRHPALFRALHLVAPPALHWPELGLTLDEPGDYRLLCRIVEHFTGRESEFGCAEVVALLRAHPDWLEENRAVLRKGDT